MNLCLERSELAILVLHMNIMRKPIKKNFKTKYGLLEGRRMLKEYDGLKDSFVDQVKEEVDPIDFNLNDTALNILHSFINWYVQEIKLSAEKQGANIDQDEQIVLLEQVNKKVNDLVMAALV